MGTPVFPDYGRGAMQYSFRDALVLIVAGLFRVRVKRVHHLALYVTISIKRRSRYLSGTSDRSPR